MPLPKAGEIKNWFYFLTLVSNPPLQIYMFISQSWGIDYMMPTVLWDEDTAYS